MAVIESPFNFFNVQRKEIFLNTTIRVQPVFGITPEAFDAVDVGASPSLVNSYAFIDNHMNPTQVKSSISMPVVGVVKASGRGVFGDQ